MPAHGAVPVHPRRNVLPRLPAAFRAVAYRTPRRYARAGVLGPAELRRGPLDDTASRYGADRTCLLTPTNLDLRRPATSSPGSSSPPLRPAPPLASSPLPRPLASPRTPMAAPATPTGPPPAPPWTSRRSSAPASSWLRAPSAAAASNDELTTALPVPAPQRRHDRLVRLQHRPPRNRSGLPRPPDVLECAVVGAPDDVHGTRPTSFSAPEPHPPTATPEALHASAKAALASTRGERPPRAAEERSSRRA